MFLCTQKHCTLIACHLKHCALNIVLGCLGQARGEGTKAIMFLCAQKHCTLIACHLKHCTLNIVLGRGGGETKAFTFLCTQQHCTLIACHLKHCTLNSLGQGRGDNSVHVPLHTKALHLDRLSSEALHLEHSLGQARGEGTKAIMFLCAQKHRTLIACHLKHCTLNIVLGRGGR